MYEAANKVNEKPKIAAKAKQPQSEGKSIS
jgi:hypothetical protein